MSYLIAILLLLSMGIFVLLIMSVVSMIVVGKEYLQIVNAMWNFKIDKIFTFTQNQYYIININSDKKVYVFNFHGFVGNSLLENFSVEIFDKKADAWISNQLLISGSPCLFTTFLKMKVYKQAKKILISTVNINPDTTNPSLMSDFINEFINKQVTQISRDKKIEKILK